MVVSEIDKIKNLLATATSPKEKAMYQKLLEKMEADKPAGEKKLLAKPTIKVIPKPTPAPIVTAEPKVEIKELPVAKDPIFQAIGIIKGDVVFNDNDQATVAIAGTEYPLLYIPSGKRRRAYDALKKEIETTGKATQRLIVYPKVTHFPSREQNYAIAFQLVGFVNEKKAVENAIEAELKDFEFILRGLWQFIPVCRTPVISVPKNFSKDRLDWIKQIEVWKKVKFMKVIHAPILWKDSPVKPFRFNPKAEKEDQGKTFFVAIKAKFLPGRDVFGFMELLEQPLEEPPKFFKASKKMKAEALKAKAAS